MHFNIEEKVFDNGLRLFYVNRPSLDISILANVNAGAIYEEETNTGISHVMEHMLFRGTKKKKRSLREIIDNEILLFGGEYLCHTSFARVVFGLRVIPEDYIEANGFLSDVLYNSEMRKEDLEREKEIVCDEERNRIDDPNDCIMDELGRNLCKGSRVAKFFNNPFKVIKNLKNEEIVEYYKEMFNPTNTTLFVVGSNPFNEIEKLTEKYFVKNRRKGRFHPFPEVKLPENKSREIVIKRGTENVHLILGKIVPTAEHEDSYALEILSKILFRGITNRLQDELPSAYERDVHYEKRKFFGELMISATCDKKKYKKVRKMIFKEILKNNQGEIPKQYIDDSKEGMKKEFILRNNTLDIAEDLLNFWSETDIHDINLYLEKIKNVTINQVREAGKKYLSLDDFTFVALGNF